MARTLRIDIEDGWYHVINRGIERRRIFQGVADFGRFIDAGRISVIDRGISVVSWPCWWRRRHGRYSLAELGVLVGATYAAGIWIRVTS